MMANGQSGEDKIGSNVTSVIKITTLHVLSTQQLAFSSTILTTNAMSERYSNLIALNGERERERENRTNNKTAT